MSSVLQALRDATHADHEAVERLVALDRPDFSLDDFRRFLEVMLAAHEPFESALPSVGSLSQHLPDAAERTKAAALRADLRALGSNPAAGAALVLTVGEALGALYVLEGSTLGARFVLASLQARFGAAVAGCSTYLEGYGDDRGRRWRVLVDALEAAEDLQPEIVAGAQRTFARVRALFAEKVQAA